MRIVVTRNSNSPVLHAAFVPIGKKGKWQKLYLHYNLPASSFCFFLQHFFRMRIVEFEKVLLCNPALLQTLI